MRALARMKFSLIFLILSIPFLLSSSGFAKSYLFNPLNQPNAQDWRVFRNATPTEQQAIYKSFEAQGFHFENWHWAWRVGFLQTCHLDGALSCLTLISKGLNDKAVVVRAEAATRLAQVASPSDSQALALLTKAYQNKNNWRAGQPLFIQFRILDAIRKFDDPTVSVILKRFANDHPVIANYLKSR